MEFKTRTSPHLHQDTHVYVLMRRVLYALIPGIVALTWYFGLGILINVGLAIATALTTEAVMLKLRGRPVGFFLGDLSAIVTAVLLGISLPSLAPWWIPVVGTAFAIIIAKQLYGGLGYNPFNPAMVGYVVLLISFPVQMTTWTSPLTLTGADISLSQTLQLIFTSNTQGIDALTGATPLDYVKNQLTKDFSLSQIHQSDLFGRMAGVGWEWVNLGFLLGGLWLIYKKVIHWHIPVSFIAGLTAVASIFHMINPEQYSSPLFHLFSGGAMLGAFFIATDPVTAATTNRGRIIFGAGIGLLTYIIRTWAGYPDGVAFAVLLMNLTVPTIDYYTKPRAFGHR